MQSEWIGAAADNFRKGRHGFAPKAIVIHIIVGSLESAGITFGDPRSSVSAHYGVGKSGRVHQFVQETDTAFHAGTVVSPTWRLIDPSVNPNFYTAGIEHEGQPQDAWPDEQYAASAALVREIADRWKIPLDRDHIIMHREIGVEDLPRVCGYGAADPRGFRRSRPAGSTHPGLAYFLGFSGFSGFSDFSGRRSSFCGRRCASGGRSAP